MKKIYKLLLSTMLVFALYSCNNLEKKIDIPLEMYNITMIDKLANEVKNPHHEFYARFYDFVVHPNYQYQSVLSTFSVDSIMFSNCDWMLKFPSRISEIDSVFFRTISGSNYLKTYDKAHYNVIGINIKNKEETDLKGFYMGWTNKATVLGRDSIFYTEGLDSTTDNIYSTLDSIYIYTLFPGFKGKFHKVNIDSIVIPRVSRNSLQFFSLLKIYGYDAGAMIVSPFYPPILLQSDF